MGGSSSWGLLCSALIFSWETEIQTLMRSTKSRRAKLHSRSPGSTSVFEISSASSSAGRGVAGGGTEAVSAGERLRSSHGEPFEGAWMQAPELPASASVPPPGVTFPRCPRSGGDPGRSEAPLPLFFFRGPLAALGI